MKFLNFNSILCLSPHPDDCEYSISGTILKYPQTFFNIVLMGSGGKFDETTSAFNRSEESVNFWKSFNNTVMYTRNYIPNLSDQEIISQIEKDFDIDDYDCILIPSLDDAHTEHQQTARIGRSLIRNTPVTLIEYKTPSAYMTWNPNLFVDIDELFQTKLNLILENFVSQKHKSYFSPYCIEKFHTDYTLCRKDIGYHESFKIIGQYLL